MLRRRLKIAADLWVETLKSDNPSWIRVIQHRLPQDARCVAIEPDPFHPLVLRLVIESSTFREDDPPDIPEPRFEVVREA